MLRYRDVRAIPKSLGLLWLFVLFLGKSNDICSYSYKNAMHIKITLTKYLGVFFNIVKNPLNLTILWIRIISLIFRVRIWFGIWHNFLGLIYTWIYSLKCCERKFSLEQHIFRWHLRQVQRFYRSVRERWPPEGMIMWSGFDVFLFNIFSHNQLCWQLFLYECLCLLSYKYLYWYWLTVHFNSLRMWCL